MKKYEITIGKETINLLNTVQPFKIAKLEIVQKWYIKNEEEIRQTSDASKATHLRRIQDKLIKDMEIIKESSKAENQGIIWDSRIYKEFLKKQFTVSKTSTVDIDVEILNKIDSEKLSKYIFTYLVNQETPTLVSFLTPVLAEHGWGIIKKQKV